MVLNPCPLRRGRAQPRHGLRGLTLVELMVALVIGLVIVMAMSVAFVASSRNRSQAEISADAIETGRYAMDLLSREFSQAGFYGTLAGSNISGTTNAPCSTTVADWSNSLALHVVGWNSSPAASDADPACFARKAGTDAIFIQRASTCAVGDAGCDAEVNTQGYLQVSECGTEYSASPYVLLAGADAGLNLLSKTCATTVATKRRMVRRIYYIDTDDALKSIDISLSGASTPTVLAENIEQMQIQYAVGTATSVGSAQTFTSTPATADWPNVVGVRVSIIAKSSDSAPNVPATSFEIGDYTGADKITYAAATSAPKRRVYTSYIPFVTPKSRAEQ